MSTVRVFELAKELGVQAKDLIPKIASIGIRVSDHLSPLDRDAVTKIREHLASAPAGAKVQERVNSTVVRRKKATEPVLEAVPASLLASLQAEPHEPPAPVIEARTDEAPRPTPTPVAHPVVETATDAAPPRHDDAPTQPTLTQAAAPPPVGAPASPTAAPPAPAMAADAAGQRPTSERAVVVSRAVDPRILALVERTRAEKGYDQPSSGPTPPPVPGAPPTELRPVDPKKKPVTPGKRLVYDQRRDHLIRTGMYDPDDIFHGGRGKKKRPKLALRLPSSATAMKEAKRVVRMGEAITVGDLAQQMMVKATQVIQKLFALGKMATVNQAIDLETASLVAMEFDWRVESQAFDMANYIEDVEHVDTDVEPRPPVVTVMGHVDHGKTTLLDAIRKARVAEGEAGGITQHIGAYTVDIPDKGRVVFIDTPGHEAFTAMRARGAKATDIVILVVAADDGVMPQTIEAINHAKAAEVPIIVAMNKIDKPGTNPDRVLRELADHGLVVEDWGGQTVVCKVSALKKEGIDHLLDMILLQAEVMELTANTKKPARGLVLEARLERGRGPVATLLVQEGVLEVGDIVVAGSISGKVRAMSNDVGARLKDAGPSTPVEVIGFSEVPEASEVFYKVKDDRAAQKIVDYQVATSRAADMAKAGPRMTFADLDKQIQAGGEVREVKLLVKGDVHGSVEALAAAIEKLSRPEVGVKVLHSGVGGITEADVNLASASGAIIIGFGVRPESRAKQLAERDKVDIRQYSIIYEALDDVKKAMLGQLSPVSQEKSLGTAEVRDTFSVPKVGMIAGCFVTQGVVNRQAKVRLFRDNVQIYEGSVVSLRRFKNDAREVTQGYECGIGLNNYNDLKVGDLLEFYEVEQIAATLS